LGQHKIEGDRCYKEAQFDKAAREYTLAIAFASNNYEPYKLRADTYKQYLKTKLNPAAKDNPDKMKQDVLDKSRTLLCRAIHADYEKAASITTKTLADINGDINLIKDKMQKGITDYDPESKVYPYYIKSSDRTLDARRMRGLYNAHRTVTQAAMNINKAMTDSKAVCETKQTGQP
jgi:hypothetical protein